MRGAKTFLCFRVGLGVWRLACLANLSAYLVRFPFRIFPLIFHSVSGFCCNDVGAVWMSFALFGKESYV